MHLACTSKSAEMVEGSSEMGMAGGYRAKSHGADVPRKLAENGPQSEQELQVVTLHISAGRSTREVTPSARTKGHVEPKAAFQNIPTYGFWH